MSDLEPIPAGENNSLVPPELPKASGPPPLTTEHSVRISALESERIWKLKGDTLWMGTEGQPDIPIPLASIREIRLAYEPSRAQTNRFRCYLHNAGAKVATIQNEHYNGILSFENRSESYNSLIRLLIPRIASLSPHCVFKTGISLLSWWAQAVMILVVFSFLLLALVFLYTAIGGLVIVKLIVIAFFIPTLIRWFKRNKPKIFQPGEIPKDLLPKS